MRQSALLFSYHSKVRATIFQVPYAFAEFCARSVNWEGGFTRFAKVFSVSRSFVRLVGKQRIPKEVFHLWGSRKGFWNYAIFDSDQLFFHDCKVHLL